MTLDNDEINNRILQALRQKGQIQTSKLYICVDGPRGMIEDGVTELYQKGLVKRFVDNKKPYWVLKR